MTRCDLRESEDALVYLLGGAETFCALPFTAGRSERVSVARTNSSGKRHMKSVSRSGRRSCRDRGRATPCGEQDMIRDKRAEA